MPANPVWQQTRSTSATLPPPFNRFPESARKSQFSNLQETYPKRKKREQIFHFCVSLFSFLFAIISPTSKNSQKNLTKKIG
jgi:hypothetical protein